MLKFYDVKLNITVERKLCAANDAHASDIRLNYLRAIGDAVRGVERAFGIDADVTLEVTPEPTPRLTERERLQVYLRRLQAEFDARDYSAYGDEAGDIRRADLRYIAKVADAIADDRPLWP